MLLYAFLWLIRFCSQIRQNYLFYSYALSWISFWILHFIISIPLFNIEICNLDVPYHCQYQWKNLKIIISYRLYLSISLVTSIWENKTISNDFSFFMYGISFTLYQTQSCIVQCWLSFSLAHIIFRDFELLDLYLDLYCFFCCCVIYIYELYLETRNTEGNISHLWEDFDTIFWPKQGSLSLSFSSCLYLSR